MHTRTFPPARHVQQPARPGHEHAHAPELHHAQQLLAREPTAPHHVPQQQLAPAHPAHAALSWPGIAPGGGFRLGHLASKTYSLRFVSPFLPGIDHFLSDGTFQTHLADEDHCATHCACHLLSSRVNPEQSSACSHRDCCHAKPHRPERLETRADRKAQHGRERLLVREFLEGECTRDVSNVNDKHPNHRLNKIWVGKHNRYCGPGQGAEAEESEDGDLELDEAEPEFGCGQGGKLWQCPFCTFCFHDTCCGLNPHLQRKKAYAGSKWWCPGCEDEARDKLGLGEPLCRDPVYWEQADFEAGAAGGGVQMVSCAVCNKREKSTKASVQKCEHCDDKYWCSPACVKEYFGEKQPKVKGKDNNSNTLTCDECQTTHDSIGHSMNCLQCNEMYDVYEDITNVLDELERELKLTVENKPEMTEEERVALGHVEGFRRRLTKLNEYTQRLLGHKVREWTQARYKYDILGRIEGDPTTVFILRDYWKKYKARDSKQTKSADYAPPMISVEGLAYMYAWPGAGEEAYLPEGQRTAFCIEFHHFISDDNTQDSGHSVSNLAESLKLFGTRHPRIVSAHLQSDGAPNYTCSYAAVAVPEISRYSGVRILSVNHNEPGEGSDLVDADCSHNVRRLNTDIIHHNHRTALDVCKGLDRDSPVRGGLNRVIDTNRANDLRKDARKGLKGTKSFLYDEYTYPSSWPAAGAHVSVTRWNARGTGCGTTFELKDCAGYAQTIQPSAVSVSGIRAVPERAKPKPSWAEVRAARAVSAEKERQVVVDRAAEEAHRAQVARERELLARAVGGGGGHGAAAKCQRCRHRFLTADGLTRHAKGGHCHPYVRTKHRRVDIETGLKKISEMKHSVQMKGEVSTKSLRKITWEGGDAVEFDDDMVVVRASERLRGCDIIGSYLQSVSAPEQEGGGFVPGTLLTFVLPPELASGTLGLDLVEYELVTAADVDTAKTVTTEYKEVSVGWKCGKERNERRAFSKRQGIRMRVHAPQNARIVSVRRAQPVQPGRLGQPDMVTTRINSAAEWEQQARGLKIGDVLAFQRYAPPLVRKGAARRHRDPPLRWTDAQKEFLAAAFARSHKPQYRRLTARLLEAVPVAVDDIAPTYIHVRRWFLTRRAALRKAVPAQPQQAAQQQAADQHDDEGHDGDAEMGGGSDVDDDERADEPEEDEDDDDSDSEDEESEDEDDVSEEEDSSHISSKRQKLKAETCRQLRERLRKRGLASSGRKADLVERLIGGEQSKVGQKRPRGA